MAIPFLNNIDLNKNEIQNVKMQLLATAPANPTEGLFYYNTTDKKAYQYNGTAWEPFGAVLSVNGKTGIVVLVKSDIGLGNVDNTSDATKKSNFTGAIADGNTGFVTGDAAYDALAGKQSKITASGILKGDGNGGVTAATAGTDYGTYSKPSGGIPQADLASALSNKIDGALQNSGGTMSGYIDMDGNALTGLRAGTESDDAVNLSQLNDAIATNTGYFRGSYATKAALDAVAWQTTDPDGANYVTNNDYAVVLADETHSNECWRYTCTTVVDPDSDELDIWFAQYRINEAPMTQAQLDAINSGITSALVTKIGANETAIGQTRQMIAGVESSSTASKAYSVGEYFVYNNNLYRVTASIASGGTIAPNTNCVEVTLGGELESLKQAVESISGTVKIATGTIGTSATSASVSYTGTVVNAYCKMGNDVVMTDVTIGSSSVTFTVAAAPSSVLTCIVAYI